MSKKKGMFSWLGLGGRKEKETQEVTETKEAQETAITDETEVISESSVEEQVALQQVPDHPQ